MAHKLQHCVIAMDETGGFIKFMDLRRNLFALKAETKVWTDDWDEALKASGVYTELWSGLSLHPHGRRNEAKVKVGGYEVVSEMEGVWIPCGP